MIMKSTELNTPLPSFISHLNALSVVARFQDFVFHNL